MRAAQIFLIGALTACSIDTGLQPVGQDNFVEPLIAVVPALLDFREVLPGETVIETLQIRNQGDGTLYVDELNIGRSPAFQVDAGYLPLSIGPGEQAEVSVWYTPSSFDDAGYLEILNNDATRPAVQVPLNGVMLAPSLRVDPSRMDYGTVPVECLGIGNMSLQNVGTAPLEISEILQTGSGFDVTVLPELPLVLEAAEVWPLEIVFTPDAESTRSGELWFTSNDPAGARVGAFYGEGGPPEWCTGLEDPEIMTVKVEVEVPDVSMMDVAFLIDTTSSMGSLANSMASQFGDIANDLAGILPDLTFGLATFEDYAYGAMGNGSAGDRPFLLRRQQTTDLSSVQQALASEVAIHSGADGPESAIEALYQGLTGIGYDQDCDSEFDTFEDVLPLRMQSGDAFGGTGGQAWNNESVGGGNLGGFGFRDEALPVLVYATDARLRDPEKGYPTPGGCPEDASSTAVVDAAAALGAQIIGVSVGGIIDPRNIDDMEDLAERSNSYIDLDGDTVLEPAVVRWTRGDDQLRDTLVDAMTGLVTALRWATVKVLVDGDTVGVVTAVVPAEVQNPEPGSTVEFTITLMGALPEGSDGDELTLDLRVVVNDQIIVKTETVTIVLQGTGG